MTKVQLSDKRINEIKKRLNDEYNVSDDFTEEEIIFKIDLK
jgi:uncharacterized protein YktB (UPF0637 family)